jgi:hypothetical protein
MIEFYEDPEGDLNKKIFEAAAKFLKIRPSTYGDVPRDFVDFIRSIYEEGHEEGQKHAAALRRHGLDGPLPTWAPHPYIPTGPLKDGGRP